MQWDSGTAGLSWTDVTLPVQSFNGTSTIAVDDVLQGESYQFQIRARNIYGFGPFSDVVTVVASAVPGEPDIALTTTQATGIVISFFAPDNNGATITGYTILFEGLDGKFYDNPECDATLTPGTNGYFSCTASFLSLRSAPFDLVYGSLVSVIVQSTNKIGTGEFS